MFGRTIIRRKLHFDCNIYTCATYTCDILWHYILSNKMHVTAIVCNLSTRHFLSPPQEFMGHHAGLTITSLAHRSLESYVGAQGEGLRGAREFGWSECPRVGHGFWISSTKSHVQHFCALECPQSVIEFILLLSSFCFPIFHHHL